MLADSIARFNALASGSKDRVELFYQALIAAEAVIEALHDALATNPASPTSLAALRAAEARYIASKAAIYPKARNHEAN